MTKPRPTVSLQMSVMRWWIGLALVYTILIFTLPVSWLTSQSYQLSGLEYHILLFAVYLPAMLVWLAAFLGYAAMSQYADAVSKTKEGPYFKQLATGCAWLAWSLPIPAIVSLLLNALGNTQPGWHSVAVVVINYLSLIFPLVAFSIIGNAAYGLMSTAKLRMGVLGPRFIMLVFVLVGVLYCYLLFRYFDLNSLTSTHNPYYLPLWLTVVTVTVPYLYTWFIGLLGAYQITLFSKNVQGLLYRRALSLVAIGLVVVILSSIALQYVGAVSPRVGHLMLNYKLVLVTLFRILDGAGFIILAVGAKRLQKIEEV